MVRVGLVGAGPWAELFHAPMLAGCADIELSGIWARRPDAAQALAQVHGTVAAPSYDALLADCDAVAFAVPPDVQADLGVEAARAGKHLLLEKPIAKTVPAAEQLAAAVADAGVVTQLVLTNRFARPARELLAAVAGREVAAVSCAFISAAALDGSVFATPWRQAEPHALLDLGPHALDLVLAVAGPVTSVTADVHSGVLTLSLRHDSGVTSSVTLSAVTPGTRGPLECVVVTTTGKLVLDALSDEDAGLARATVADDFVRAIRGDLAQPLDAEHGLALQRLLRDIEVALRGSP